MISSEDIGGAVVSKLSCSNTSRALQREREREREGGEQRALYSTTMPMGYSHQLNLHGGQQGEKTC